MSDYSLSDDGNAQRLAKTHYRTLRCSKGVGWIAYYDGMWQRSADIALNKARETARAIMDDADPEDLKDPVRRWAESSLGAGRIESMLRLAKSDPALSVLPSQLNANPFLLGCTNGIVDLTTGHFMPHDPGYLITNQSVVRYDASATCPTWIRFLADVTEGNQDLVDMLQQAVGYSLTGSIEEQALFILYGTGANGKSTFTNTVHKMLGSYATWMPAESFMLKRFGGTTSNDIAGLHDKRLVLASEPELGATFCESKIKAMTGENTICARFLYGEFFEFEPKFKIWLSTNHKPKIKGTEEAIWRRIKLIPFSVVIQPEKRDKNLLAKLAEELPGILNWAIEGCIEWKRGGEIKMADVATIATDAYRVEQDFLSDFINDSIEVDPTSAVSRKDLYTVYKKWSESTGAFVLSMRRLSSMLEEKGFKKTRIHAGTRAWESIRLTPDAEKARSTNTEYGR
jgi:putative DNA primase/helicase